MDPIEGLVAELFRLQPALEEVAVSRDCCDTWRVVLTLPRGSGQNTRIIHTPGFSLAAGAFEHARQLLLPRGEAAL